MLARAVKQDHLRQGLVMFHHLRKRAEKAHLVIYSSYSLAEASQVSGWQHAKYAMRRFGRRWLMRNPGFLIDIPFVEFRPLTIDSISAIESAHIVLGMGRVLLEGVSAGRPSISRGL